jgi:hypothetical protein
VQELAVQLLVGVVDAELLEGVLVEVLEAEYVQDADRRREAALGRGQRTVDDLAGGPAG